MLTLKLKRATPNTESLKPGDNISNEDRQILAYIKISQHIDRNKYRLYNNDNYLFIVNILTTTVILAFYDDVIVINQENTTEEQALVEELKVILDWQFSNLNMIKDVFVIDSDSQSLYIGKAALEYQENIKGADKEERVLH